MKPVGDRCLRRHGFINKAEEIAVVGQSSMSSPSCGKAASHSARHLWTSGHSALLQVTWERGSKAKHICFKTHALNHKRALLLGVEFTIFRVRTAHPEHWDKNETGVLGHRCTSFPLEAVSIAVKRFGAILGLLIDLGEGNLMGWVGAVNLFFN